MGGNSGPSAVKLSFLPCFSLLSDEMVGLPCREDRRFFRALGITELDGDVSPQHIAAASARASKFVSLRPEAFDTRHLHLQTLLQLQGFRSDVTTRLMRQMEERELDIQSPRCRASAGVELGIMDACITSFNPFGSAGMMGMNLLAK
jgi:hypothetical protein